MSSVDTRKNTTRMGARARARARLVVVVVTVLGLLAVVVPVPQAAFAAPGSLINGVVWADTNRDGARNTGEPARSGVTVQLLSSPGGAAVATTTTTAAGAYSFAGVADGDFVVRVDAPGAFRFPASAGADNSFTRGGDPLPGQPERGVTAPFTIGGATQVTGLDAGLQPIADLLVERLPEAVACDGFAVTGLPPFDASDGPGLDSGPGNCVVRVGDTVLQNYSVALTGLPTGASVPNVVADFTVSSPDGAKLELVGPGVDGLPAGCLSAANGAYPPSSRTLDADGSITVRCNLGTMSSNVAAMQLSYRFAGDTPIPSNASIAMHAFAAGGDAGISGTVAGPVVEVTGTAKWELEKVLYTSNGTFTTGPTAEVRTINGGQVRGYLVRYQFNIEDMLAGAGGSELVWPATFTDVMPEFPNARIDACRGTNVNWEPASGTSQWTLTCPPLSEAQGADGWNLSIKPNNAAAADSGQGHMVMDVFIPLDDMNRAISSTWQPGQPTPTGAFDFENRAQGTDTWHINGGALNFGDAHESGWDGTGNNLAIREATAAPPQWDLQKGGAGNLSFSTQIVDGVPVDGYEMDYNFSIRDLAGAGNVAPWLDSTTFHDKLVSHPRAVLLSCRELQPGPTVATVACETGVQPADGWEMSATPTRQGYQQRVMNFIARIFIPLAEIPSDPCTSNVTIDLRNEAVGSEDWTVDGQPNNPTGLNGALPGYEPGWNGTEATGNNLAVQSIRPSAGLCGTLSGDKAFIRGGYNINGSRTFGGDIQTSFVSLSANNNRVKVDNLRLCDVFDVSVFELEAGTPRMGSYPAGVDVNPANYVIEYAIGPNDVNTQAGPLDPTSSLFPIDKSSLSAAATNCRDYAGPWSTDPAADFGAVWLKQVNMVRVRPIDPAHVETGPFSAHLIFELETRTFYNGGPNDGEAIPSGVRVTNIGGWPTGTTGAGWGTVARERVVRGMELNVAKTVTPTQYLPGTTAVWDLDVSIGLTTVGATLRNLQVVDTIPESLNFDLACTQALLPPGVTVSYDPSSRQARFRAGDIPIVTPSTQWVFEHSATVAPRLRICTTVDTLAQPGDTSVNRVQAMADNAENQPTAQATIQIVGSGQMGISKQVDKPLVASGEPYSWSLDWGNTSTVLSFLAPDVIDVLPWNGDGADDALSGRDQYASAYQGTAQLTGQLAAPQYIRGGTGAVPGTWFYTTAAPATLNHDPRDPSNGNPASAGGLWLTAAEVSDFGDVTAVRFVSSAPLPVQSRVRAVIPAVSTSTALDNVYVNRAMIFSATFANQPLLSNEPYVLMPGFSLGDLVWIDRNGNGIFDGVEQGVPGVTVQVRDDDGTVVSTRVTDAAGRWSAVGLPAGTYTAHIPASMFATGGPLADHVVRTIGSGDAAAPNEGVDNNNTASADPKATGLTSAPVTMAYEFDGGSLVGANGPTGDDVAGLAGELIPDAFTTFTIDLAVMPAPAIDIEKATNGQDADAPSGPNIAVGGAVRWTYVVTNTGGVDLTNVTVTDDQLDAGDIDCDGTGSNIIPGLLAPDASFTCVATGTAIAGQYENLGTVTGVDPTQLEVSDDDPSHYFGVQPAVDIEKATNGRDADEATGPNITVGGEVRWTYAVTNTGNVPVTNVTVTDDLVAAADIDCDGTGGNVVAGPLAPDDSFTCVATGTATAGQYENTGTVAGTGPETTDIDGNPVVGATVTDDDPSHYFGIQPAVDIEKATNGQDADEAPGPNVAAGGDVRWTYVVTNTGDTPLTNVTVTDDVVAATEIDCDGTGGNVVAGPLAPDASFTCVATGTAVEGQYANLGTVTGTGSETTDVDGDAVAGARVTDGDPSHYFGSAPTVDIEKATNGQDADEPTGPNVTVGGEVRWTYVVMNTGNVPLTNVIVTDDEVAAAGIDCDGTDGNVIAGPLAAGASFTCVATGIATGGQYANLGTVVATGPGTTDVDGDTVAGATVTDEDLSHYFGGVPPVPPVAAPAGNPTIAGTGWDVGILPIAAGGIILGGLLLVTLACRRRRDGSVD